MDGGSIGTGTQGMGNPYMPQNLSSPAQGKGGGMGQTPQPSQGMLMGGAQYDNSGLGRFLGPNQYSLPDYQPTIYRPETFTFGQPNNPQTTPTGPIMNPGGPTPPSLWDLPRSDR